MRRRCERRMGRDSQPQPGPASAEAAGGGAPVLERNGTLPAGSAAPTAVWVHLRVVAMVIALVGAPSAVLLTLGTSSAPSPTQPASQPSIGGCVDAGPVRPQQRPRDVDGDGCPEVVTITPPLVEITIGAETVSYLVGTATDEIVIGDWDCDGTATPLLYRAKAGALYRYDRWPDGDELVRPAVLTTRKDGVVEPYRAADCDRYRIVPA